MFLYFLLFFFPQKGRIFTRYEIFTSLFKFGAFDWIPTSIKILIIDYINGELSLLAFINYLKNRYFEVIPTYFILK